ncbi:MAG TPA: hypothetical protein VHO46_05260 [Bacteroidales bacterium]|nr:hypothetical protein [Bacteroidales bacterium]
MKRHLKLISLFLFIVVASCNEPETIVTNYVHRDGSITRKIEMRNAEKPEFKTSDRQVPFDSTWIIRDSLEINTKGDTTWIRTAEKTFLVIEALNLSYKLDSGANAKYTRYVSFEKKFRWFNTTYRFSENIDKILEFGYPVRNFLNKDELAFFYSPQSLIEKYLAGADSLKYKALNDSVRQKTDIWMIKSIIFVWIGQLGKLTADKVTGQMIPELRQNEDRIYNQLVFKYKDSIDSLWKEGVIQKDFLGEENAELFKAEADSAAEYAINGFFNDFRSYHLQTVMPGRLTGTNGFADTANVLLWPVNSVYFTTEPYEMWAESKVVNVWAWIISGMFILFVMTGFILRATKKAE